MREKQLCRHKKDISKPIGIVAIGIIDGVALQTTGSGQFALEDFAPHPTKNSIVKIANILNIFFMFNPKNYFITF